MRLLEHILAEVGIVSTILCLERYGALLCMGDWFSLSECNHQHFIRSTLIHGAPLTAWLGWRRLPEYGGYCNFFLYYVIFNRHLDAIIIKESKVKALPRTKDEQFGWPSMQSNVGRAQARYGGSSSFVR